MGKAVLYGVVIVALLALGGWLGRAVGGTPPPVVIVDTASAAQWRRTAEAQRRQVEIVTGERDGLGGLLDDARRTIEGLEMRPPERITVFDTIIDIRSDTVLLPGIRITERVEVPVAVPDSTGHRPEIQTISLPENCDEGITILATGVVCDAARLGHLNLGIGGQFAGAMTSAPSWVLEAGAWWEPSYRSTKRISATIGSDGAFRIAISFGWRLF